jgi:hypothetical protein
MIIQLYRTNARWAAVRCKAEKEKPNKFAIRFFCVDFTAQTYAPSMMDHRSEDETK